MLEHLANYLSAVWESAETSDVIDVGIVATLAYVILLWLSKARSRVLATGTVLLGGIYLLAELLDLQLTMALFRGVLAVLAVVVVVLFQDEIRRSVEALATWASFREPKGTTAGNSTVDVLARTLWKLASERVGALIVLTGREALTRHLAAGVSLDAHLSEPLLHSLFDPSSPGHDGAVVVRGGRAVQFGAHLPLSTRITGREGYGTRHTAALGLSERTDALILVVSEERGTVSVAHEGQLRVVSSDQALRRSIEQFNQRLSWAGSTRSAWRSWFGHRLGLKLASIAAALVLWLATFGYRNETGSRTVNAAVVVEDLPEDYVLQAARPSTIQVTLSGPAYTLEDLSEQDVSVSVSAADAPAGATAVRRAVTADSVNAPGDLIVSSVRPSSLTLSVDRMVQLEVPVVPSLVGEPPPGRKLVHARVRPSSVVVRIPQRMAERTKQVRTQPISLAELEESTTLLKELIIPSSVELSANQPSQVAVELRLIPRPPDGGLPSIVDAGANHTSTRSQGFRRVERTSPHRVVRGSSLDSLLHPRHVPPRSLRSRGERRTSPPPSVASELAFPSSFKHSDSLSRGTSSEQDS